jgi:hypothetical protein
MPPIDETKMTEFKLNLSGVNPKLTTDIYSIYLSTVL